MQFAETQTDIRTALSGFKSPLTGLTTVMTDADREAQLAFTRELEDLDANGALEYHYARTIALDNWRLNRIKTVEENIFAYGHQIAPGQKIDCELPLVQDAMSHALSYLKHGNALNGISLYESRLARNIERFTDLLLKLQARRQQRIRRSEPVATAPKVRIATQAAA